MSVRCEECKYENLPQHSFCGMCGAKLPSRRQMEREREEAQAFSRPSLLGLAAEDATEAERTTYLLEDEPKEHRGRLLVLLVLGAAIAGSAWHWRTEMRAWIAQTGKNPSEAQATDANTVPPVMAPSQTASPSAAASSNPSVMPQQAPAADSVAQNTTTAPPTAGPSNQTAVQPSPAVTDAVKREPEPQEDEAAVEKKPALKPAVADVTNKATVRNASADALEAEGENYLYGNGVPADCGRASKSLLAAARSSAKAQTVLGTMYATGHCVTRDVPIAYHWFAKASHEDPGNVRIQRDLEVLWAQMTPEEREIAIKTRP
jgi:cytoskeletal protein RodZ